VEGKANSAEHLRTRKNTPHLPAEKEKRRKKRGSHSLRDLVSETSSRRKKKWKGGHEIIVKRRKKRKKEKRILSSVFCFEKELKKRHFTVLSNANRGKGSQLCSTWVEHPRIYPMGRTYFSTSRRENMDLLEAECFIFWRGWKQKMF